MVKSREVTIVAGIVEEKHAEIDVFFIRFPWATDGSITSNIVSNCNSAFALYEPGLRAENPRLSQVKWAFWKCTVDVIGTASPVPWPLIIGFILGVVIAGLIIYWVVVRPVKEAAQEIVMDIDSVIASKYDALARGDITQEYADQLDADLEEAKSKAEEAGKDPLYDWVDYLKPILEIIKYMPYIIAGTIGIVFISTLASAIPRRRG